jgi:hypothetical protein
MASRPQQQEMAAIHRGEPAEGRSEAVLAKCQEEGDDKDDRLREARHKLRRPADDGYRQDVARLARGRVASTDASVVEARMPRASQSRKSIETVGDCLSFSKSEIYVRSTLAAAASCSCVISAARLARLSSAPNDILGH